jgi:hypothetical protein
MVVGWWNVIATFRSHSTPANLAHQVSALFCYTRGSASHQRSSHEKAKQLRAHVCVKFFLCFGSTGHIYKIWPPFAQTSCVLYSCFIPIKLKDDNWTRLQIECSVTLCTDCTKAFCAFKYHMVLWELERTEFFYVRVKSKAFPVPNITQHVGTYGNRGKYGLGLPDHDQQHCYHRTPTVKPGAVNAIVSSRWWAWKRPKHVEPHINVKY